MSGGRKADLWELFNLYYVYVIEREKDGHKSHAIPVSDFSDMFSYWRDTSHVLLIRLTRGLKVIARNTNFLSGFTADEISLGHVGIRDIDYTLTPYQSKGAVQVLDVWCEVTPNSIKLRRSEQNSLFCI